MRIGGRNFLRLVSTVKEEKSIMHYCRYELMLKALARELTIELTCGRAVDLTNEARTRYITSVTMLAVVVSHIIHYIPSMYRSV